MHHLSKDVRAELRYVLIGEIVCSALICVVFALLHRLDYTVPLGAVWGSFFALLNLYLLARRVQRISAGKCDSGNIWLLQLLKNLLFCRFVKQHSAFRIPGNRILTAFAVMAASGNPQNHPQSVTV